MTGDFTVISKKTPIKLNFYPSELLPSNRNVCVYNKNWQFSGATVLMLNVNFYFFL